MRFIGAMISALGSLLPLKGPAFEPNGLLGTASASGNPEAATETEGGGFTSTLLRLLNVGAPAEGEAPSAPANAELGSQPEAGSIPGEGSAAGLTGLFRSVIPKEGETGPVSPGPSAATETSGRHEGASADARAANGRTALPDLFPPGSMKQPGDLDAPVPHEDGPFSATSRQPAASPITRNAEVQERMESPGEGVGRTPSGEGGTVGTGTQSGVRAPAPRYSGGDRLALQANEASSPQPEGRVRPQGADGASEVSRPRNGAALSESGPSGVAHAAPPSATDFAVDRDPGKLAPEFRQRLERVISRMKSEFGHQVTLVEGYRSPERQEAIYAQGRTEPGPVATWTRNSLHSKGLAADLQIDGSWNNPEGYARLQKVAQQEGLRVLGNKDPGHLELPEQGLSHGSRPTPDQGRAAVTGSWAGVGRVAGVPRPTVARVANPARVASPAQIGSSWQVQSRMVAQGPGAKDPQVSGSGERPLPTASGVLSPPDPSFADQRSANTGPRPSGHSEVLPQGNNQTSGMPGTLSTPVGTGSPAAPASGGRPSQEGPDRLTGIGFPRNEERSSQEGEGPSTTGKQSAEHSAFSETAPSSSPRAAATVGPTPRADSIQRVHEIQSLTEAWEARSTGRVHLDLENADGAGTRLRLALRGSELAGSLDLNDPVLAGRMRQRIGDLHEALSRQGLEGRGIEARAITGVEGRGGSDGELAALLKDPLTGLARILETREALSQNRSDGQRPFQEEPKRGWERFRNPPQREKNKENQR